MVVVTLRYIKQTESLASLHKQQQHTRDPHYEIIVCIMKLIVSYHEVCIMKKVGSTHAYHQNIFHMLSSSVQHPG
jgi:hypothetical protein